jgi:hypothetical protein
MRTLTLVFAAISAVGCATVESGRASPTDRGEPMSSQTTLTSASDSVLLCAVRDGVLVGVQAEVNSLTGDTLIEGRPVAEVMDPEQPPYAGTTAWHRGFEPIIVRGYQYPTEGSLPRHILPYELRSDPIDYFKGIPVFVEAGVDHIEEDGGVYYVLVSPDCRFQPYYRAV